MKNVAFYDKEGPAYSKKRYPAVDTDYLHFFFKKRLAILLKYLDSVSSDRKGLSLLEVGCADGVVARAIAARSNSFSSIIGIDLSEGMIAVAKERTADSRISFSVRGAQDLGLADVVVEIGVLNLADLEEELLFAKTHLAQGGYYLCSIASRTSLRNLLKFDKTHDGLAHLRAFAEYEYEIRKHFTIVDATAYGLFIPLIWKIPFLARLIQPCTEFLLKPFAPALFHEKIYLLRA